MNPVDRLNETLSFIGWNMSALEAAAQRRADDDGERVQSVSRCDEVDLALWATTEVDGEKV
jgi:hypothetical protein